MSKPKHGAAARQTQAGGNAKSRRPGSTAPAVNVDGLRDLLYGLRNPSGETLSATVRDLVYVGDQLQAAIRPALSDDEAAELAEARDKLAPFLSIKRAVPAGNPTDVSAEFVSARRAVADFQAENPDDDLPVKMVDRLFAAEVALMALRTFDPVVLRLQSELVATRRNLRHDDDVTAEAVGFAEWAADALLDLTHGETEQRAADAKVSPVVWRLAEMAADKIREGRACVDADEADAAEDIPSRLLHEAGRAMPVSAQECGVVALGLLDAICGWDEEKPSEGALWNVEDALLNMAAVLLSGCQAREDGADLIRYAPTTRGATALQALRGRLRAVGLPEYF